MFPGVSIMFLLICLIVIPLSESLKSSSRPNIVFILTDDQDVTLGGQTPMKKTKALIGDNGIIFNNMFTSSPLCCPSRSSILTGRYTHNHQAVNNSLDGNCSSPVWQQTQEVQAFPTYLKKQGYTTFFAGKYLNQYGFKEAGDVEHVPPGWDWWIGLVGNSVYYDYTLSVNGTAEKHGHNYTNDYLTDVINRRATDFLSNQSPKGPPFFMMMSTPACHAPFTPAPQYNDSFANKTAPRGGSYNVHGSDKHWLVRQAITPLPNDSVKNIDNIFRNRWRTLLSVDDMVQDIVTLLMKRKLLDNTYLFFSSDNGYHLGQMSLPNDKRQMYDFDIRVPLMVRGPNIKPGQKLNDVALNIDLGPTFIDIAGHPHPMMMDGISLLPILDPTVNRTVPLRHTFLVEHQGEYGNSVKGCPQYKGQCMANCNNHCVCEDSQNNTYGCVVYITDKSSMKYCEFLDKENFVEIYDLIKDPFEMKNIAKTLDPKMVTELHQNLAFLSVCSGPTCSATPNMYRGSKDDPYVIVT